MPRTKKPKTKAEVTEATTRALLAVARELFARKGYAGTSTDEVVRRARVTRGALYYHYRDKKDLFRAVYEDIEQRVAEEVAERAFQKTDAWEQLEEGCRAFLDACMEPAYQQIALQDAPSVLGWPTWREIDAKYGLGLLQSGLVLAMEAKAIEQQRAEPLAHVILASLCEAGLVIAHADNARAARKEMESTLMRLLEGLRPPTGR